MNSLCSLIPFTLHSVHNDRLFFPIEFQNTCSAVQHLNFPYLNTTGMSDKEIANLEDKLRADFRKIDLEFASLTFSLRKSLMSRNISPAELADLFSDLQEGTPLIEGSESTLQDQNTNIKDARDILAAFDILRKYYSFFNYDIITLIVENLGCDRDHSNLKQYKEAFNVYCHRTVYECPLYMPNGSESARSHESLEFVLKLETPDQKRYKMSALRKFKVNVAQIIGIQSHLLNVKSISDGCIEVKFQLPYHLKSTIYSISHDQERELHNIGVQKMIYDGKQVDFVVIEKKKVISMTYVHMWIINIIYVNVRH